MQLLTRLHVIDYRYFWNTERTSLNINSVAVINNCFSYRNFRLPMSASATVYTANVLQKLIFYWVFYVRPYHIADADIGSVKSLRTLFDKAKKNKSYVSKLPRAFVFRCAFDSVKFKVWIFFACLIFFPQFFMNLLVKIYRKRYDRHNETLWTTYFFNSVFYFVFCSSKNQVPYFKAVTDSNLTRLLLRKKKKKKKKTLKKPHLGRVFQSVTSFETYHLFFLA